MITILDTIDKVRQYNEKYMKNQLNGIYLYKIYMNNCYYCQSMQEEWSTFLKNIYTRIKVIEIERKFLEEIINPMINKVTRYPTILILKNNLNREIFVEERTVKGFNNFVKQYINKNRLTGEMKKNKNNKNIKKNKKTKGKNKKQKVKTKKQKVKTKNKR